MPTQGRPQRRSQQEAGHAHARAATTEEWATEAGHGWRRKRLGTAGAGSSVCVGTALKLAPADTAAAALTEARYGGGSAGSAAAAAEPYA